MKKQLIGLLAIAIAVGASAFTTVKHSTVKKTSDLFWYQVTYDDSNPNGAVLSSDDFIGDEDKSEVVSPCDAGTEKDCVRGFNSAISTFPDQAMGTDHIQRPND